MESSYLGFNENLLNMLSPDSIEEKESYIRSGMNFTRTLVAVEYSAILAKTYIQKMNDVSDNISIVQYLAEYDSAEVRKNLSESIKQNRQKAESKYVNDAAKADANAEIDSATMTLNQLSYKNEKMFMFQMVIHIVAKDLKELDTLTQQVKSIVGPFAKTITPMTKLKDAFDSFLPLGKNKVYDLTYRPMNAEAASYFFPFHENELFDPDGIITGRNLTTGNVVIIDDNKLHNKHSYIVGMSGLGKSTFLWAKMIRKWMTGTKVRTIDPKGEFGRLYKSLGGEWVRFSLNGGSIINPFDMPRITAAAKQAMEKEGVSEGNPLLSKISTLLTMFRMMYPALTDLQDDILSKYLIMMYKEFNIDANTDVTKLAYTDYPIINDFYEFLEKKEEENPLEYEKISDFHTVLYSYAKGLYANILNGYTNVDINNDLVDFDIIEMQENPKLQRLIYFNLLSHLQYDVINGDLSETALFIDEAHIIADPEIPLAMRYLYNMMKVLRSFNCGVTPASQSIKDFLSAKDNHRNYGEAVISQATQRFYLPMSDTEVDFMNKELNMKFSEEELTAITVRDGDKREEAGKGIYFVGSKKIKLKCELTDLEARMWFDKTPYDKLVV